MKRLFTLFAIGASCVLTSSAYSLQDVRFHDESSDTTRINNILVDAYAAHPNGVGDAVAMIGRKFVGCKYVAHTLEGDSEMLTVNIDEFDCTTFVETVAAMAITVDEKRTSWRDFLYNLEKLRYRDGALNGYASRMHYVCDWVTNNAYRGIVEDATVKFPYYSYAVKTIDFMSNNRDKYPALSDSAAYAGIRSVESNYKNHRYPYIKSLELEKKQTYGVFKDGDIVAMTTNMKNLDVTHMGIIVVEDGEPHLLHASSTAGEVVITNESLGIYLKKNRSVTGVRVIRLKD